MGQRTNGGIDDSFVSIVAEAELPTTMPSRPDGGKPGGFGGWGGVGGAAWGAVGRSGHGGKPVSNSTEV